MISSEFVGIKADFSVATLLDPLPPAAKALDELFRYECKMNWTVKVLLQTRASSKLLGTGVLVLDRML